MTFQDYTNTNLSRHTANLFQLCAIMWNSLKVDNKRAPRWTTWHFHGQLHSQLHDRLQQQEQK